MSFYVLSRYFLVLDNYLFLLCGPATNASLTSARPQTGGCRLPTLGLGTHPYSISCLKSRHNEKTNLKMTYNLNLMYMYLQLGVL